MFRIGAPPRCRTKDLRQADQRNHAALQLTAKCSRPSRYNYAHDGNRQTRQRGVHRAAMPMVLMNRILKRMPYLAGGQMLHPRRARHRAGDVATICLGFDHNDAVRGTNHMIQLRHTESVGQKHIMQRGQA
jgi:hypothetical protein